MATVLAARPVSTPARVSEAEAVRFARQVLDAEAEAIARVRDGLDRAIAEAAERILNCPGSVVVTGMGKAGLVGQKLAATLASTGTHAFPLHPGDAVHGDLGRVRPADLVLALSRSGETEEVNRLIPSFRKLGAGLIAITERPTSALGRAADLCLALGPLEEACPLGLAPSASTTAMMALGDALALLVSRLRGFAPEDFLVFHPGGSLGRKLGRVEDVMRTGRHVRTAHPAESVREVLIRLGGARRRSGAVLVVDDQGVLQGIFTDSDLARLFERRLEDRIDGPIAQAMTRDPVVTAASASIAEAVETLRARKISELPVVDEQWRLLGLLDITDLIGLGAEPLDS